ncbi:MAG: alpha/beta fold hydrolase, partial [Beijerinckiaceae bacterium]
MPWSNRNGLRIHYEVHGDGPPLVLVHANPFDRRLWTYQVSRFSPFFRVIAVDLRGYGLADKPVAPFTLRDMADEVLGVGADAGIVMALFAGV